MLRALALLLLALASCHAETIDPDEPPCFAHYTEPHTHDCSTDARQMTCTSYPQVCRPCHDRDGSGCWVGDSFRRCLSAC